jgi:hypothetical protein
MVVPWETLQFLERLLKITRKAIFANILIDDSSNRKPYILRVVVVGVTKV